jgi:CheY-like chemotaxis protein
LNRDPIIKILYADDDSDDSEMFSDALKQLNLQTELRIAQNGAEALSILSGWLPDIIFLDINMPVKCGRQCLKEIRSDKKFKDIPVVIYSTSQGEPDITATLQNGAGLYVFKSYTFNEQVKTIELVLDLYQRGALNTGEILSDYRTYGRIRKYKRS